MTSINDTALHEAGHAVLGILCGIGIDYIDVRPNALGSLGFSSNLPSPYLESRRATDTGRETTVKKVPGGPHPIESPIYDVLMAGAFNSFGGYVAEQSLTHLSQKTRDLQSAHDAENAMRHIIYAMQVIPSGGGSGTVAVKPSCETQECAQAMLRWAEERFSEHRDVIDALASALAKAGRLETAEIHRIVIEGIVAREVSRQAKTPQHHRRTRCNTDNRGAVVCDASTHCQSKQSPASAGQVR